MSDDAFERLAMMALSKNGLYGARVQAQQYFDKITQDTGELFHSGQIMRRAWDSLLPEQHEEALNDALSTYYARAIEYEREEEMNRRAREEGHTFLEHDDLEVISYTCFAVEGENGIESGVPEDGIIGVEIALVARLIDEIELLRAKLRLKEES